MKKILFFVTLSIVLQRSVLAFENENSTLKQENSNTPIEYNQDNYKIIPISEQTLNNIDLKTLKHISKSKVTIYGFINIGNPKIPNMAKEGVIKNVRYVQHSTSKGFGVLCLIPFYYEKFTTTVYGE